jgi:hypothetical protein
MHLHLLQDFDRDFDFNERKCFVIIFLLNSFQFYFGIPLVCIGFVTSFIFPMENLSILFSRKNIATYTQFSL